MKSRNFIPFEESLYQTIGPILTNVGFEASTSVIEREMKAVIYKQINKPNDQVWFYAMVMGHYDLETRDLEFNWLRCHVISRDGLVPVLPSLSIESANPFTTSGWVYTDEEDMKRSLNELREIIERELRQWFPDLV